MSDSSAAWRLAGSRGRVPLQRPAFRLAAGAFDEAVEPPVLETDGANLAKGVLWWQGWFIDSLSRRAPRPGSPWPAGHPPSLCNGGCEKYSPNAA
jgi:hypothetical protein